MEKNLKSDITPFEMYDNLFFVGSSKVSVHIIRTEKGLVMIDTGYPDMYEQILNSMEKLGLDPKDLCAIFHSHGHIDHFGGTIRLKELSGAKTYISRIDNEIVNGTRDLSWAKELGMDRMPPFNCDVLVNDGDCFTFGSTTVRCRLTPGHTEGTLSFFITFKDNVIAAMHGGIGFKSMSTKFLTEYNLSFDCREKFINGLHALADERVDLVLGNHPGQTDTQGKLKRLQSGEASILDPTEWKEFLKKTEKSFDEFLKRDSN